MKNLRLLIFALIFTPVTVWSQCSYFDGTFQWPTATITPSCTGTPQTISTVNYGGDYFLMNVTAGQTYVVSTCGGTWDSELTVFNNATQAPIAYNDDNGPACAGSQASVQFTASFTGVVRVVITEFGCLANSLAITTTYTCGAIVPPPSNDNCIGAVSLTQNATCVPTNGNTAGATQSQAGCTGTANEDVWYSFVATSTSAQVNVTGSSGFDAVFEVFSGNCNGLTSLACIDNTLAGANETTNLFSLTPGATYYIRVYDWFAAAPTTTGFSICVQNVPGCSISQPAGAVLENEPCGSALNDGCNATPNVYQDITCGTTVFGSAWATGGNRDTDWYRFTINTPTTASWLVNAEFPANMIFADITDCANPIILNSILSTACQPQTLTYTFTAPGTYVAFVSPDGFDGYPCGTFNDYTATLTFNTVNTVNFTGTGPLCAADPVYALTADPAGGNWSGGSYVDASGNFNPSTASIGSNPVTYTTTDDNGCTISGNASVTVNANPDASLTGNLTYCAADAPVQLSAATPGGSWSGAADAAGNIDPQTLGAGVFSVGYNVTVNGCSASSNTDVTINSNPQPIITPAGPFCSQDAPQNLTVDIPGGTWSGTGISPSGSFDPSQAAIGINTVTYSVTENGCSGSATLSITVLANPTASIDAVQPICVQSNAITLNATPSGGTWGGAADASGSFDAALSGTGSFDATYTVTDNGCSFTATVSVVVTGVPDASFSVPSVVCSGSQSVSGNPVTPNGNWSGPVVDVTGTINVPLLQPGTYPVYYSVFLNGCTAVDSATITIQALPDATVSPVGPLCANDQPVQLQPVNAGGTWSGNGVDASGLFSPATVTPGVNSVTYTLSDNNCSSSFILDITVIEVPMPVISPASFCKNDSATVLSATPSGGVWSGIPINVNGEFDPALATLGLNNVTYTVNVNGCIGSSTADISVNPAPVASFNYSTNIGMVTFTNTSTEAVNYTWNFGDNSFSNSTNPTHNYANGEYTVTLVAINSCGSDTSKQIIKIEGVGIENQESATNLEIFPNPTTDQIQIQWNATGNSEFSLIITDVSGRVLVNRTVTTVTGNNKLSLPVHHLANGVYILKLSDAKAASVRRFVKN
jgi:hypothetical protein